MSAGPIALALMLAQAAPFTPPPVPDPELATHRGGFRLPNGIDVALTVQTQTAVDGAVVLRTVFRADQGAPTLTVYAPKPGETVAAPHAGAGASPGAVNPVITYDSRTGIHVTSGAAAPISVVAGKGGGLGAVPEGLAQVADGTATAAGAISEAVRGGVRTVELRSDDLSVTHIAGDAFGSAIANSGSDRSIDTVTSVQLDLANAGPDVLGSSMLRVEGVALDASRSRF